MKGPTISRPAHWHFSAVYSFAYSLHLLYYNYLPYVNLLPPLHIQDIGTHRVFDSLLDLLAGMIEPVVLEEENASALGMYWEAGVCLAGQERSCSPLQRGACRLCFLGGVESLD